MVFTGNEKRFLYRSLATTSTRVFDQKNEALPTLIQAARAEDNVVNRTIICTMTDD